LALVNQALEDLKELESEGNCKVNEFGRWKEGKDGKI